MIPSELLNHVYLGDYLEFLRLIPDKSVDLVLCDPPYGIGYQNNYTSHKHEILTGDEAAFSYSKLAKEAFRVLKDNSAIFCFTGWSEYGSHFLDLQTAGFTMKEPLILQKRPAGKTDLFGSFQSNSDWCLFAHKGRFRFYPTNLVKNKRAGVVPNKGRKPVPEFKTRFPSCWFGEEFPYSSENSCFQKQHELFHPTIKSKTCFEWLIRLSTETNMIVCDPFMGTGTTAIAAEAVGRHFIGSEINPDFCSMISRRLKLKF